MTKRIVSAILIVLVLCGASCAFTSCEDVKYDITIKIVCWEDRLYGKEVEEIIVFPVTNNTTTYKQYDGKTYVYMAYEYRVPVEIKRKNVDGSIGTRQDPYPAGYWFRIPGSAIFYGTLTEPMYVREPGEYLGTVYVAEEEILQQYGLDNVRSRKLKYTIVVSME